MERAALNRLRWRCRRGLLELDIVLERFLGRHGADLEPDDLAALAELLAFEDNELWDVVSGRSERYDPKCSSIVARLRAC
ncbi:MAG: succinate dehydrogenase assembly factor 2 [Burkholderiales bacterium]